MKKATKTSTDAEPQQPRYKRITDPKSPLGRAEIAYKSPKVTDNKSLEYKNNKVA